MDQAIKSKKSQFLERWSNAEIMNAKLGVAFMVMMFLCSTLTVSLVYLLIKPRSIYYIPGVSTAGVAYEQTNSIATVSIFAASWALNWSNFTPATVEAVYKHAQQFMSPQLLNQTKSRFKKDIEQVKNNNISSMFSLNQDPQVEDDDEGFNVTIKGDKGIYMGKEEIKTQRIVYHIRLRSVSATDWNPYGLIIENITQEASL